MCSIQGSLKLNDASSSSTLKYASLSFQSKIKDYTFSLKLD